MSTNPVPITLQTNLQELRLSDCSLQLVLHCQASIDAETVIPEFEHKAVFHTATKYVATRCERVLSPINKTSFFADPTHRETLEREVSKLFVLLTTYDGQDKPPAQLVNLDLASAFASDGSAPDIVFETAPSALQLSANKRQWRRTQIITSNIPGVELDGALKETVPALHPQNKGLSHVFYHGLGMSFQELEVDGLLSSNNGGNDFVDESRTVKIPLAGIDKLVRAIRSSPIPPMDSKSTCSSDGLTLTQATAPSLYQDGPRLLVAEMPHIYVTPDPKPDTLADLLTKQFTSTSTMEDRTAKLKKLGLMLKGLKVNVRVAGMHETRVISAMWDGNSRSAPSQLRHHAWAAKRDNYPLADLPCFNVGSSWDPVLLPPELCFLLPNQDLRGAHTASLSRSVEKLRLSNPPARIPSPKAMSGWSIARSQSEKKIENLRDVSLK